MIIVTKKKRHKRKITRNNKTNDYCKKDMHFHVFYPTYMQFSLVLIHTDKFNNHIILSLDCFHFLFINNI